MLAQVAVGVVTVAICLIYVALKPPRPKVCGSPGGPPVTSSRITLRDGRHLAYQEAGVAREVAKFKIILVHGFNDSKDMNIPGSKEVAEKLGICLVSFDRAGYGDSDPNPKRSVKSEAFDIEELADQLNLGEKFFLVGASLGGYSVWSCLYYIPHRLAGVALLAPFVSFWWRSFPDTLLNEAFNKLHPPLRWTFHVARHAPWLLYLLMSQTLFPPLSFLHGNFPLNSKKDEEILEQLPKPDRVKPCQQGIYESLCRDMLVGFSTWEFNPTDVVDPFPNNEGSVHIWQGVEDKIVPFEMNQYISQQLQWIRFHELPDHGHYMCPIVGERVFRELVTM